MIIMVVIGRMPAPIIAGEMIDRYLVPGHGSVGNFPGPVRVPIFLLSWVRVRSGFRFLGSVGTSKNVSGPPKNHGSGPGPGPKKVKKSRSWTTLPGTQ